MQLFYTAQGSTATVTPAMFKKFKDATGVANPTANTLRKSATTNFLDDPLQRDMEPEYMDHDKKVAKEHYDKGGVSRKVSDKSFCTYIY